MITELNGVGNPAYAHVNVDPSSLVLKWISYSVQLLALHTP